MHMCTCFRKSALSRPFDLIESALESAIFICLVFFLSCVCIGDVSEVDEGNDGVAKDVPLPPDHSLQPLIILVLSSITAPRLAMLDMSLTGTGHLSRCWWTGTTWTGMTWR